MIEHILRRLSGEVRVRVRGASIERFLNACARGGIRLRGTRRVDVDELHTTLSVADFKRLRGVMGRTGCRVHILRRRGAPFTLHRLRRRYVLLAGAVLAAVLFYALTAYVWVVEVVTAPGISAAAVRRTLTENGVYAGVRIDSIDPTLVRHRVKRALDGVSYITLSRIGNYVRVEAYAERGASDTIDGELMTGVVAAHDGVITEMLVRDGSALKQVGDAVLKGDLLVTALVPPTREEGSPRLTHAMASVTARTVRGETALRPLTRQVKRYTGREKTQFALVFGQTRINLYLGSGITAGTCDKIISAKRLSLGRGMVLPVTLVRQTYRFYKTGEVTLTADDVQADMERCALGRIKAGMIAGQVDRYDASVSEENGAARLVLRAECTEEIGAEIVDDTPLPAPEEKPPDSQ